MNPLSPIMSLLKNFWHLLIKLECPANSVNYGLVNVIQTHYRPAKGFNEIILLKGSPTAWFWLEIAEECSCSFP